MITLSTQKTKDLKPAKLVIQNCHHFPAFRLPLLRLPHLPRLRRSTDLHHRHWNESRSQPDHPERTDATGWWFPVWLRSVRGQRCEAAVSGRVGGRSGKGGVQTAVYDALLKMKGNKSLIMLCRVCHFFVIKVNTGLKHRIWQEGTQGSQSRSSGFKKFQEQH